MKVKIRQILIDQEGRPIPDTDTCFYDVDCESCGPMPYVSLYCARFLCLGCIDLWEEAEQELLDDNTSTKAGP